MYYIVGSGPAGIACAYALTSTGRTVTILDGGVALEPEREAIRAAAALRPRAEWTEPEIAVLRTVVPGSGDVPQKLVHGSDYPYRRPAGPGHPLRQAEYPGFLRQGRPEQCLGRSASALS